MMAMSYAELVDFTNKMRAAPPMRVSCAMHFVTVMRNTRLEPPTFEDGPPTAIQPTQHEDGAYNAALECLRTYFNGEMNFELASGPTPPSTGDDFPPSAGWPSPMPGPPFCGGPTWVISDSHVSIEHARSSDVVSAYGGNHGT